MTMPTFLKRFKKEADGATAIEAAFIIPIFFAIVLSTFEVGYVFFKEANVEQEMAEAAREVKVGRAFTADFEAADVDADACPYGTEKAGIPCPCSNGQECFFEDVCQRIDPFLTGPCTEQLSVEVHRYASFDDVPADAFEATCPNDEGYVFNEQVYEPGKPNDIVHLRACFLMDTFSPILGAVDLATEEGGVRRVISVQLHRNEPYDPDDDEEGEA